MQHSKSLSQKALTKQNPNLGLSFSIHPDIQKWNRIKQKLEYIHKLVLELFR